MAQVNTASAAAVAESTGTSSAKDFASLGASRTKPSVGLHRISLPISTDIAGAQTASEEFEYDETLEDGVESVVGVSISRHQTRLMSPKTPAAEKSAALDQMNSWGFFDDAIDKEQEALLKNTLDNSASVPREQSPEDLDNIKEDSEIPSDHSTPLSTPSPQTEQSQWKDASFNVPTTLKANKEEIQGSDQSDPRADDKQTLSNNKVRSNTMNILNDLNVGNLNVGKFMSHFSFPSVPEPTKMLRDLSFFPSGQSTKDNKEPPHAAGARHGRSISLMTKLAMLGMPDNKSRAESSDRAQEANPSPGQRKVNNSGAQFDGSAASAAKLHSAIAPSHLALRRSVSDSSLRLSRMSSLVDDSRWDHINSQVNSRMKAIKDSLQDSLPDIPNINLGAFKPNLNLAYSNGTLVNKPRNYSTASDKPASPTRLMISKHPTFQAALEELTGDLVILGGYRGSILRSAEAPYRQLWAPVKVGLTLRKVNLEVGLNPEDEENMEESIFASGMLTHIGPVDMSRRLFKKLRNCRNAKEGKLRIHDYGYDWRLSPALLSRKLMKFLESLPCNRGGAPDSSRGATVIAHSMGGLITRYAVNARPELFAGVAYVGTPQHCVNILGPLRNGDEVLLSSKVLTAQVNFTMRSSFALLPEGGHCFMNGDTKEPYHVDFFDAQTWTDYALSPCMASCLPAPATTQQRKGIFGSFSGNFPNPLNPSQSSESSTAPEEIATKAKDIAQPETHTMHIQMDNPAHPPKTTTIPIEKATAYLERTLAESLAFKRALVHNPSHETANLYPPHSVMYSTSIPTVYGARVASREAIKYADAFDNLAFASGDGVVIARAAMIPQGYRVAKGGRVRTTRGHVTMLGDFEALGSCLLSISKARKKGVGLGPTRSRPSGLDQYEESKEGRVP